MRCRSSGQAPARRRTVTGRRALADECHQPPAALSVGARPRLAAPRWSVVRRVAGGPPGARVAQRDRRRTAARPRCRPARRAPSGRPTRWPRSARRPGAGSTATSLSAAVTAAGGNSPPPTHAGQHAAHVGVQHRPAVGRTRRPGRPRPCSRRRPAGPASDVVVVGDLAARAARRSRQRPRGGGGRGADSRAGPTPGSPRRRARRRGRPGVASAPATRRTPAARGRPASAAASPPRPARPTESRRYAATAGRAHARRTTAAAARGGRTRA